LAFLALVLLPSVISLKVKSAVVVPCFIECYFFVVCHGLCCFRQCLVFGHVIVGHIALGMSVMVSLSLLLLLSWGVDLFRSVVAAQTCVVVVLVLGVVVAPKSLLYGHPTRSVHHGCCSSCP